MQSRSNDQIVQKHYADISANLAQTLAKYVNFTKEYSQVSTFLSKSHTKLSHDIMVPIVEGLAYMPGYITNTNKTTVSIGCNYFSESSTVDALNIVERRQLYLKEKIEETEALISDLELKRGLLGNNRKGSDNTLGRSSGLEDAAEDKNSKKELNEEGLEYVDITEEYVSETDEQQDSALETRTTRSTLNKPVEVRDNDMLNKILQMERDEESVVVKKKVVERKQPKVNEPSIEESRSHNALKESVEFEENEIVEMIQNLEMEEESVGVKKNVGERKSIINEPPKIFKKQSLFKQKVAKGREYRIGNSDSVSPQSPSAATPDITLIPSEFSLTPTKMQPHPTPILKSPSSSASSLPKSVSFDPTIPTEIEIAPPIIMHNTVVERTIMKPIVTERTIDSDDESDLEMDESVLGQHVSLEYMLKRERLVKARVLRNREGEEEEPEQGKV